MTEKPILFSTEMVRAILSGRKTQTRRVIKEPCDYGCITGDCDHDLQDQCDNAILNSSPYGKPGGKLWVRETWKNVEGVYYYKADIGGGIEKKTGVIWTLKWKPSIHMPRKAARIILEVTAVRVERLQDISEIDAKAEGIEPEHCNKCGYTWEDVCTEGDHRLCGEPEPISNKIRFRTLWNSINEKRGYSWESNPYVWVVEFKRIDP